MSCDVVCLCVMCPAPLRLSAAAASTLEELKTQTRAGLEHAVSKRKVGHQHHHLTHHWHWLSLVHSQVYMQF